MARPRINPAARSVPISFSVKPHLAEKIDEYSHQIRFSRSKFLAQAVTEAITKIELGHDLDDYDVRNMTDNRIFAIAIHRLQNPTPEQEINQSILDLLRKELGSAQNPDLPRAQDKPKISAQQPIAIDFVKARAGKYVAKDGIATVGVIEKGKKDKNGMIWHAKYDDRAFSSKTLAEAKAAVAHYFATRGL